MNNFGDFVNIVTNSSGEIIDIFPNSHNAIKKIQEKLESQHNCQLSPVQTSVSNWKFQTPSRRLNKFFVVLKKVSSLDD